jgi:hypothetical protein
LNSLGSFENLSVVRWNLGQRPVRIEENAGNVQDEADKAFSKIMDSLANEVRFGVEVSGL